jgi:hypothetical protein
MDQKANATDYYQLCAAIDDAVDSDEAHSVDEKCGETDLSFIKNSLELPPNRYCVNCEDRRKIRRKLACRTRVESIKYLVLAPVLDEVKKRLDKVVGWCCKRCAGLKKEKEFEWVRVVSPSSESERIWVDEWRNFSGVFEGEGMAVDDSACVER